LLAADALLAGAGADGQIADAGLSRMSGGCKVLVDLVTLGGPADSRASRLLGLVEQLRRRGFWVHGVFTLGFDHDDSGSFERLVAWVEAAGLVSVELKLWTPAPNSDEVRRLAQEDRVRHFALDHWDGAHVVIAPKQMSAETLYRGWAWARGRLASPVSLWVRRPREWGALPGYFRQLLSWPRKRAPGVDAGLFRARAQMVASYRR
jgi:hypothetical protein